MVQQFDRDRRLIFLGLHLCCQFSCVCLCVCVCVCVSQSLMAVNPAQTAEPIEMPFGKGAESGVAWAQATMY